MAAKRGNSEPGPASSMDPDDDQRLSVELLISQLVEQASLIMTAHKRVQSRAPYLTQPPALSPSHRNNIVA